VAAFRQLAEKVLGLDSIDALLVPRRQAASAMVMPTLVSAVGQLGDVDPLAPAFALNAAKVVSSLTRKSSGHRLAVMLRPCEIRAFIELVKLNQGTLEEIVIIGSDCLGAMANSDYLVFAAEAGPASTSMFYEQILEHPDQAHEELPLAAACRVCDQPLAEGADLAVWLLGVDTANQLILQAQTDKGEEVLDTLALPPAQAPAGRDDLVAAWIGQHTDHRDRMFAQIRKTTDSVAKLSTYFSACVNCYNCRVACPVCYCRECVFVTDVFQHEPFQYLNWSRRRGALKLPGDTVFYHLTRLAHMSTACVGCGQCSNACPNGIPVMEVFRLIAHETQAAFGYHPGVDVDEKPPLTEFREQEFEEVVGISN
jgi:formate dehydrogenase subunit beta